MTSLQNILDKLKISPDTIEHLEKTVSTHNDSLVNIIKIEFKSQESINSGWGTWRYGLYIEDFEWLMSHFFKKNEFENLIKLIPPTGGNSSLPVEIIKKAIKCQSING
jgi:hypothetical protein